MGKSIGKKCIIMQSDKKKDELQSRRQFFKNAAKGSLPFLSAIMLINVPAALNAAEESPMNCTRSCSNTCSAQCRTACKIGCDHTCSQTCTKTCGYTCKGGSYGT